MSPATILSSPAAFEEYNEDERIALVRVAAADRAATAAYAAKVRVAAEQAAGWDAEEAIKQRQGW